MATLSHAFLVVFPMGNQHIGHCCRVFATWMTVPSKVAKGACARHQPPFTASASSLAYSCCCRPKCPSHLRPTVAPLTRSYVGARPVAKRPSRGRRRQTGRARHAERRMGFRE